MALPHAILVLLTEQSGSGYELPRRFGAPPAASFAPEGSIGHFWSATHQQIHRRVRGGILAEEGSLRWLDEVPIAPGGHR